jgi:hypothetical protein
MVTESQRDLLVVEQITALPADDLDRGYPDHVLGYVKGNWGCKLLIEPHGLDVKGGFLFSGRKPNVGPVNDAIVGN